MSNTPENIELVELTIKKLIGEATPVELGRLDALLAESAENHAAFDEYVQTWEWAEKARGITNEDVEHEWKRLDKAIQSAAGNKFSFSYLKVAAAVTLLVLGSVAVYFFNGFWSTTEFTATEIRTEKLPDGSDITINAGGRVSFSKQFIKASREVELEGEAFFDIKSMPDKPFVVHTALVDVKVTGTSFNVKEADGGRAVEVVVASGQVEVSANQEKVILAPGEKAIFSDSDQLLKKEKNLDPNFEAWRTKVFQFSNMPFSEVLEVLNNAFHQGFYMENDALKDCPITVSFDKQSLESIIKVLQNTLDAKFTKTPRGILVTGDGC